MGAFLSGCPFLEQQGYKIILFDVILRNRTNLPVLFNLRNFVLTARDGRTYGPVNIRSVSNVAAANYIPERGKLPPKAKVTGYVTFDARTGGPPPIAARISYIDGTQTLSVVFEGKHTIS